MLVVNFILNFPDNRWTSVSRAYNELISEVNNQIKDDLKGNKAVAIDLLYELVWGTLEYLEADAQYLLKNKEQIKSNIRMKAYLDQISNIMLNIEEISLLLPGLSPDRYVLYLDTMGMLYYLGFDGLSFINEFFMSLLKVSTLNQASLLYLSEFAIFLTEIGLKASESKNYLLMQKIFELGVEIIHKINKYDTENILSIYLGLGISYELQNDHNRAAHAYQSCLAIIEKLSQSPLTKGKIKQSVIHEIGIYGYLNSFLASLDQLMHEFFDFRTQKFQSSEAKLLGALNSALMLGQSDLTQAFPQFTDPLKLWNLFDTFRPSISSSIAGSNLRLYHIGAETYFPKIIDTLRKAKPKYGIVVFECEFYKDIEVIFGKEKLPTTQILTQEDGSSFVDVLGTLITVTTPFVWATTFQKEIDVTINYNKISIKKHLSFNPVPPTVLFYNISKEISELNKLKEGKGQKFYNKVWSVDMSVVDIMRELADVPSEMYVFDALKDFAEIFKKLGLKEIVNIINKLRESIPLTGYTLKLVLLQRLSELVPDENEATDILETVVKQKQ